MFKSAIILSLGLVISGPAMAADADLVQEGNAQFQLHCAPRHGSGVGNEGAKMPPRHRVEACLFGIRPANHAAVPGDREKVRRGRNARVPVGHAAGAFNV